MYLTSLTVPTVFIRNMGDIKSQLTFLHRANHGCLRQFQNLAILMTILVENAQHLDIWPGKGNRLWIGIGFH